MNRYVELREVREVAVLLGQVIEDFVFVGGAIIELYAKDEAAPEARPTEDIDMAIGASHYNEIAELEERLRKLNIYSDPARSLYGFVYKDILLDFIPMEPTEFGPANRWFKPGLTSVNMVDLEGVTIKILSAPYFLATKFEAFNDRGEELRLSHDIEDIIYVIDNRPTIVEEIAAADDDVRAYLSDQLGAIVEDPNMHEIVSAHLEESDRFEIVSKRIEAIAKS